MKKTNKLYILALSFILVTACDDGFNDLNTSKTGATSVDPVLVLNNAVINSSPTPSLNYEIAIVQQWFSSNTGVLEGGNFNKKNIGNTPANWVNYYQNVIKYTNDVITRTKSDATRSNLYNMARIIQANAFMILTDTYGDIPYSEAGGGYTAQVFFPKYEAQSSIYPKIIDELTQASASLDAAGKIETSDVLYAGNIAKWKKFGYSLLLRAGMRISKADAAKAQSAVAAAFAGGPILVNADNAIIFHDANYVNGIGNTVNGTEAANYYLGEPFVNALKSTSDPRLSSIAVRYVGATSGPGQTAAVATTAAANQFGMKVGATDGSAQTDAVAAGLVSRYAYSQVDRTRLVKRTSPMFVVTAGQTNLLLAEAVMKGWVTSGTAPAYFAAGISAHMDQMATYDAGAAVLAADRNTYVAANPLNADFATNGPNANQQVGYQYWIASFLHGPEAWANFRRTGFPTLLTPNPFVGDIPAGTFIARVTYPPSEILVNGKNVTDAITSMGADALSTKVWWNK